MATNFERWLRKSSSFAPEWLCTSSPLRKNLKLGTARTPHSLIRACKVRSDNASPNQTRSKLPLSFSADWVHWSASEMWSGTESGIHTLVLALWSPLIFRKTTSSYARLNATTLGYMNLQGPQVFVEMSKTTCEGGRRRCGCLTQHGDQIQDGD